MRTGILISLLVWYSAHAIPVIEFIGTKCLVHHYEDTAHRIFLSWGNAHTLLKHLKQVKQLPLTSPRPPIAIVGSSITGLTLAALLLNNAYPVHLYAPSIPDVLEPDHERTESLDPELATLSSAMFEELAGASTPTFNGVHFVRTNSFSIDIPRYLADLKCSLFERGMKFVSVSSVIPHELPEEIIFLMHETPAIFEQ